MQVTGNFIQLDSGQIHDSASAQGINGALTGLYSVPKSAPAVAASQAVSLTQHQHAAPASQLPAQLSDADADPLQRVAEQGKAMLFGDVLNPLSSHFRQPDPAGNSGRTLVADSAMSQPSTRQQGRHHITQLAVQLHSDTTQPTRPTANGHLATGNATPILQANQPPLNNSATELDRLQHQVLSSTAGPSAAGGAAHQAAGPIPDSAPLQAAPQHATAVPSGQGDHAGDAATPETTRAGTATTKGQKGRSRGRKGAE